MSEVLALLPGQVPSEVRSHGLGKPDHNGFVTALAVRTLRCQGRAVPAAMLSVLERCRSATGGFGFWPQEHRPAWAPALPDDADDTAVMTLELLLAGRLDLHTARRIACQRIGTRRIARLPAWHPPWLRTGVFATWSRMTAGQDMVDCTVITNVLALLRATGLEDIPGAQASRDLLAGALDWAGDDEARACSLSPFYPDPAEWMLALDHAALLGAQGLSHLRDRAARTTWGRTALTRTAAPDHPVCSSPYGGVQWFSPVLCQIRLGNVARAWTPGRCETQAERNGVRSPKPTSVF